MRKRGYEILLPVTYAAMLAVCVYFAIFSPGQRESISNVVVNAGMFVIVGVIFVSCQTRCFGPVNSMIRDLDRCALQFRQDAANSKAFLWDQYAARRDGFDGLFTDNKLQQEFRDYRAELDRIGHSQKAYYKCDIEDYINYDLIDTTIHRNMLNQVAGVMTGLGILGTFIGLSLGLQSFNTGTTAEITNSVEPLMDGIKVAFHTSIYGMVFSLVFNFVYKKKLDDADASVDEFLSAFRKYVLPDTTTDGINKLMELEQQQTEATKALADTVSVQLAKGLQELLEPQFDRFDKTIADFASFATENQTKAVADVTDHFLEEMDRQMGNTFTKLEATVEAAYQTEQENASLLKRLEGYTGEIRNIQYALNRDVKDLPDSVNEMFHIIDSNLVQVETSFARTIQEIQKLTDQSQNQLRTSANDFASAAGHAADAMDDFTDTVGDVIARIENAKDDFDV